MRHFISGIFALVAITTEAQTISDVLHIIETNNLTLASTAKANEADIMESKAENTIGATSVEYSPFFQKNVNGTSSSELIVSQEFDFPTLYAARRKAEARQHDVQSLQQLMLWRDIVLQAEDLCHDLILVHGLCELLGCRLANADSLLAIYQKRLYHGEGTIIELNSIKMERTTVMTSIAENNAEYRSIMSSLQTLNGGKSLELTETFFHQDIPTPLTEIPATEATLDCRSAAAQLEAARQGVKVARQGWMPKLSVGYRRNTELRTASNGFLVGASWSLFSTGKNTKAAQLRGQAAEIELERVKAENEAELLSLQQEASDLYKAIQSFDTELISQTLSLITRAVNAGEMTITEYYTENNRLNQQLEQRLKITNQYCKIISKIKSYQIM